MMLKTNKWNIIIGLLMILLLLFSSALVVIVKHNYMTKIQRVDFYMPPKDKR